MKDIHQKLLATFQIEHRDNVEQIRSLLAMIDQTGAKPAGPELEEVFRRAHSLKGAARAVDLREVEELAHRLETLFSRVRQGALLLDKEATGVVVQVLDASEDYVTALSQNRAPAESRPALQAIERLLGMEPAPPAPAETPAPVPSFEPIDTVRVSVKNFDGMLRSTGGLLMESVRQHQVTQQLAGIARQIAELETAAEPMPHLRGQVRVLSRHVRSTRLTQQRSAWAMGHLGKQLQRDVWQARMVPAESLLEGCRKMVRDLARDQSKEIEFRATSSSVQADRRVLQAVKDPIMHLLRNAVSHGIEALGERTARGKAPTGLITLRVDSKGHHLTVAVQDDGRGVDLGRVAEVAVQQGILPEAEASRQTPEALARMVFRPGFSTASAVTNLSGRGMGLSVVYEAARRLQGEVDLKPADGGGTSILVSVPLLISTHRLLLVACVGRSFALPMYSIERLHRIAVRNVETVEGRPAINIDGRHIALFSLSQLLGLEESTTGEVLPVAVLQSGGRRAAVAVDAFLSETDAVIQDLGPVTPRDGRVSGGILLENGAIALVLSPLELMATSGKAQTPFLKPNPPAVAAERKQPSILVVDDSMTTRTLEKSILEAHGYRVSVAVDGIEALTQLRAGAPDLVITDLQMPRMDGFGLLEAIRADASLNRLPVIVVTSLERREDQERGMALGADAYIVKRKFDQGELLAAIRQIL